jgi:hypothetical protein
MIHKEPPKMSEAYYVFDPSIDTYQKQELVKKDGTYFGEIFEGERYGQGKFIFTSGAIYEGTWRSDKMHGRGRLTHSNGDIYLGQWVDGMADGEGVC